MAALIEIAGRMLRTRALWRAVVALCVPATLLLFAEGPIQETTEYRVKAAFLMNFTKFVEWPASAFRDDQSPLTICVLGDDPFGAALDDVVSGETAAGRKLAVSRIRQLPAPKACQVLFVPRSERDGRALAAVGPGVLTVGEDDAFLRDGGIIAFVLVSRHVRFDVNLKAAAKASLGISSRLLSVAREVQK